jgi:tRNA nucleotidyltransferase (CCA-adding enzyme)
LAYAFWLIRLPSIRARKVTKRLRVSSVIAETVENACNLWDSIPALQFTRPSEFVAQLDKITTAAIYAVYCASEDDNLKQNLFTYITEWQFISPQTTGHDLHALGLPPGPHYKAILTELRLAWLDGQITSSEEEAKLLDRLLADLPDKEHK